MILKNLYYFKELGDYSGNLNFLGSLGGLSKS